MLKAADALADDGHDVRVVATRHEPWATETDLVVQATRPWRLVTIDYRRGEAGVDVLEDRGAISSGARCGGNSRSRPIAIPLSLTRAFGRVHTELVAPPAAESTDLLYGGTTGALAAVAEAAARLRVPYALDLEDLHHGEASGVGAPFEDALALRIERAVLPQASFLTTSSEAIGQVHTAAIRRRTAGGA